MQSDFPPQANRTEFLYPGKTSAFVSLILILSGCLLFFRFAYAKDEGNNPAAKRHAIVISVDGLPPDLYLHPDKYGLKIPHIRRLRAEGSYAEAVEGVYPSATYPSHTTLVTGRWPREHGVYTKLPLSRGRKADLRPLLVRRGHPRSYALGLGSRSGPDHGGGKLAGFDGRGERLERPGNPRHFSPTASHLGNHGRTFPPARAAGRSLPGSG